MRFNKLDLNLLVALDALLNEQNVSRAAELVHVSQSTMSHTLARLREHFNDELLMQVGRGMELTPRGELLRDPIRDILVRIASTVDSQPRFDPTIEEREFVLHLSDYSMEVLLPHVFALCAQRGSRVRFRLLPQAGNPARLLERGEVDMLIIPQPFCSAEHPLQALFVESLVALMWSQSRLAKATLTLEEYKSARHVVMHPIGTDRPAYDGWLMEQLQIARDVGVATYCFTPIPEMLVGTEMLATVHARLARRATRHLPLQIAPLPFEMPTLSQAMQWHKHRSRDPALTWLRELIAEASQRVDEPAAPA